MKYKSAIVLGIAFAFASYADGTMIGIRSIEADLAGVHTNSPQMKLSTGRAHHQGRVLVVDCPAPGSDPAARDIWFDVENPNLRLGKMIVFNARAERAIKLSVSFVDRNRVAYTSWTELRAGEWQTIRIGAGRLSIGQLVLFPDDY